MKLNIITLALVAFGAALFIRYTLQHPWTAERILGLAIAVPAFVLFVAARLQLGRAFSVQAKASTLVSTGIYARIRNPIYVFGGLMIAGVILWAGYPWALLIFAVLIPLQVQRARHEARVLEATFGEAYRSYKRATWF